MSVVIRDIDKPRDCDYCHFQTDSYCHVLLSYINVEHGVDTRCPIIEINEYTMKNEHKVVVADTPQTESTGSPIGDYRDGVGAWQTDKLTEEKFDTMIAKGLLGQTDCSWREPND